jgi:hypothetical protein
VPTPARRSRYDRWIGPVIILAVLLFCLVAAGAGAVLLHHALGQ